jgi:hypothetical protein
VRINRWIAAGVFGLSILGLPSSGRVAAAEALPVPILIARYVAPATSADAPAVGGLGVVPGNLIPSGDGSVYVQDLAGGPVRQVTPSGRSVLVADFPPGSIVVTSGSKRYLYTPAPQGENTLYELDGWTIGASRDISSASMIGGSPDGGYFLDYRVVGKGVFRVFPDGTEIELVTSDWLGAAQGLRAMIDDAGTSYVTYIADVGQTQSLTERLLRTQNGGIQAVEYAVRPTLYTIAEDGAIIACDDSTMRVNWPNGAMYQLNMPGAGPCYAVTVSGQNIVVATRQGETVDVYQFDLGAVAPWRASPPPLAPIQRPFQTYDIPTRVLDTRPGGQVGYGGEKPSAETTFEMVVSAPVMWDRERWMIFNLTVTDPESDGYATVWSCENPRPNTSVLNFRKGQTVANLAISRVGLRGSICIFTSATAHFLSDASGYLSYVGGSPGYRDFSSDGSWARRLDSRPGGKVGYTGAKPGPGSTLMLETSSSSQLGAVVLNITATEPDTAGFITVYPCDEPRPNTSNLNFAAGETAASFVISKVDVHGDVCLYTSAGTHVLVDQVGIFSSDSAYTPRSPVRYLDAKWKS